MSERTTGATDEQQYVKGVDGSLVRKEDYDFTTKCADAAWAHMTEFYGPEGMEQIRIGMSKRGVRRLTAAVLNAANSDGYVIARAADVLTAEQRAALKRIAWIAESGIAVACMCSMNVEPIGTLDQLIEAFEGMKPGDLGIAKAAIANGGTDDQ